MTAPGVTLREGTPPRMSTTHGHTIYTGTRGEHQKHMQEVWHPGPLQRNRNIQNILVKAKDKERVGPPIGTSVGSSYMMRDI